MGRTTKLKQEVVFDTTLAKDLVKAREDLAKAHSRIAELEQQLVAAKQPQADPVPAALAEFKKPPTDPLQMQFEMYRMLVISAYEAATDTKITSATRRKEIRTITASAAKMFPDARRWEVEQLIKSDRAAIEKRASEKRGAKLERVKP